MKAGDALPPLERTITIADMVAYAGATWDHHRMHYDRQVSEAAGLPGPVVDGQALGALMAEQLIDHLGPRAFITHLSFRFRSMVFAGETVRCEAEVTEVGEEHVSTEHKVTVGERVAATGSARVRL
ncbi:MAG TPA: MaoC/PaaZ C-terminal domain-containing protein [Actinomycetota bacterium]|nr:MaoC/PaaZ C-terminal domain-containing protein [Actinomycetota bacterium]